MTGLLLFLSLRGPGLRYPSGMFGFLRSWRRRRLARTPVPETWRAHLLARAPFFARLSSAQQERLLRLAWVFGREKHFIPAGGMLVDDEVRAVISACAARLVLELDLGFYDRLTEIVVYPYDYQHPDGDGAVLGEAHQWGTVVLSWPSVLEGLRRPSDGHDTALHEFAHVLDVADGDFDGTPALAARADYRPWAEVMSQHFLRLVGEERPEREVLRAYGATNEAEFFAVATETFFERPVALRKRLPELYDVLREFYRADPAELAGGRQPAPGPQR